MHACLMGSNNPALDAMAAGQKQSADVIAASGIDKAAGLAPTSPGFDIGGFFTGILNMVGRGAGSSQTRTVVDLSGGPKGPSVGVLVTAAVAFGVVLIALKKQRKTHA